MVIRTVSVGMGGGFGAARASAGETSRRATAKRKHGTPIRFRRSRSEPVFLRVGQFYRTVLSTDFEKCAVVPPCEGVIAIDFRVP